jgi:hypothetical protein
MAKKGGGKASKGSKKSAKPAGGTEKMDFKSKTGYQKWLAYGHMHGQFEKTPGSQQVTVGGKPHKVKHSQKKTSKRSK